MDGKPAIDFAQRKSFEIAYALLRVSEASKNPDCSGVMRSLAFEIIKVSALRDILSIRQVLAGIEHILRLGDEFGLISSGNSATIIAESRKLLSVLPKEFFGRDRGPAEANLSGVFTKEEYQRRNKQKGINRQSEKKEQILAETPAVKESKDDKTPPFDDSIHNPAKSGMRQSAIIERIRQIGNCRLKDIQEILPDLSERTIRYDLQNMIEKGEVERVGGGGPSTYYRLRGSEPGLLPENKVSVGLPDFGQKA